MAGKALRLLLLDAGVVMELHRLGLWEQVVEHCDVLLARAVLGESKYYDDGESHVRIDLKPDIAEGRIRIVDVKLAQLAAFQRRFQPTFLERLDAGEAESLAYMTEVDTGCIITSADKIVWRTLGALRIGEDGISLEEILGRIGLGRRVGNEFSKSYRQEWTQRGFEEGLRGEALRQDAT